MQEPQIIVFLLHIAGAAALLIWAVRLVRTGVERAFSTQLRQWLRHSADNRIAAAGSGLLAAIFLQSSTAVAILISNFVGAGRLAAAAGPLVIWRLCLRPLRSRSPSRFCRTWTRCARTN